MVKPENYGFSRGFSLIELMLAMLIGLIIIGGVMSLYVSTRNTQQTAQDQLTLISNANFVIETIADDMRQAGYWGEAASTSSIYCRTGDSRCSSTSSVLPTAIGDCANGWYADLTNAVAASDNLSNYIATCTTQSYKSGTDVIWTRYANSNTVASANLASNVVYLRSNFTLGGLFVGQGPNYIPTTGAYSAASLTDWKQSTANDLVSKNHELMAHLYYISNNTVGTDGIPSLHLVDLEQGPTMKDTMLISNVVDLQIQFGVETSNPNSGTITLSYVNPGNVPVDSTTGKTEWSSVKSAKIWVLVRSARKDLNLATPSQTFTLANHGPITYNDGHRYYMMSSIVQLRNNK